MAPAAAYAAELTLTNFDRQGATLTVTADVPESQIFYNGLLPHNPIRDNYKAGVYLKGPIEGKSLNISVTGGSTVASDGSAWPPYNQLMLMGNFQGVSSSDYNSLINGEVDTNKYSTSASGGVLNLTLEEGAKIYSVLYGGRNDLVGTDPALGGNPNIGDSCGNIVNITLKKGSTLGSTLIFGGRSGQGEGATADTNGNPYNVNLKKGYRTDNNTVIIKGEKLADNEITVANRNMNFPAGGIFGAEGWQANNNYVSLQYAYIQSAGQATRKFGIVGGRGVYNFRIYDGENSAIANNNIVVIKDSAIGTFGGPGMSVMGGYSYGQAKNNIVVMENTKINGHVYGGLELFGMTEASPDHRRQLHSNLVSLHNVELIGNSSIYGTATADSKTWSQAVADGDRNSSEKMGWFGWASVDEQSIKAVNRRRGIAHIGGQVKAGSA